MDAKSAVQNDHVKERVYMTRVCDAKFRKRLQAKEGIVYLRDRRFRKRLQAKLVGSRVSSIY